MMNSQDAHHIAANVASNLNWSCLSCHPVALCKITARRHANEFVRIADEVALINIGWIKVQAAPAITAGSHCLYRAFKPLLAEQCFGGGAKAFPR